MGHVSTLLYNATKVYTFFCDAEWDVKDRETLMDKGKEGLEFLNKVYRRRKK